MLVKQTTKTNCKVIQANGGTRIWRWQAEDRDRQKELEESGDGWARMHHSLVHIDMSWEEIKQQHAN